jgi:hypothetical protein
MFAGASLACFSMLPSNSVTRSSARWPAKGAEEGHCRAAHEKLAFDLGYLAHLPVTPVVLWREGAPAQYKRLSGDEIGAVGRFRPTRCGPMWMPLNGPLARMWTTGR